MARDWDDFKPTALAVITLVYLGVCLGCAKLLLGDTGSMKLGFAIIGYSVALFFVALKFSATFRRLLIKPEANTPKLVKSFNFPIALWLTLPTLVLFLPGEF